MMDILDKAKRYLWDSSSSASASVLGIMLIYLILGQAPGPSCCRSPTM